MVVVEVPTALLQYPGRRTATLASTETWPVLATLTGAVPLRPAEPTFDIGIAEGRSLVTSERQEGFAADPLEGPAKTQLADC
jgi:hypothetical protein